MDFSFFFKIENYSDEASILGERKIKPIKNKTINKKIQSKYKTSTHNLISKISQKHRNSLSSDTPIKKKEKKIYIYIYIYIVVTIKPSKMMMDSTKFFHKKISITNFNQIHRSIHNFTNFEVKNFINHT